MWRIANDDREIIVLPSLKKALVDVLITVGVSGLLWWGFHKWSSAEDAIFLFISETFIILIPTLSIILAGVFWARAYHGGVPYLKVSRSTRVAELPRHGIRFQAGDAKYAFVHECFTEDGHDSEPTSEFNVVLNFNGDETSIPLLKFLGKAHGFGQLGEELQRCGFRFFQRTTQLDSGNR
jgi:hypothetical protein